MDNRKRNLETVSTKSIATSVSNRALDILDNCTKKIGVLLCEGDESSIDKAVYSAIFPELIVIPLESCTSVMRSLIRVRSCLAIYKIYAFGIIDRDALSKSEIKKLLKERQVYTTKLPFIENIICSPGVIQILCEHLGADYDEVIAKINEQLMKNLWQKFKEALPINLGIEKNERIENLKIGAATKKKEIEKIVSAENILYAYRSKIIVSIVANAVRIDGRNAYYDKIKQMLQDENYRERLVRVMSKFVPDLTMYDFEEY